ncbi:hypothetical protein B566_EDAN003149 [Ephemera danica]|nr:hypothetical protein B566_EDAN003149 [Ephemera danica]
MRTFGVLRKALPQLKQKGFNLDYASFMNELALSRTPSALRELMKNHATASSKVVFLGEGLPHPLTTVFSNATFTLRHQFHAPPQPEERDVITTVGAQDGLSKVLELSLERGDSIVVADPTYSGLMSIVRPYQTNLIAATFNKHGLNVLELKQKLSAVWSSRSGQKRPKILYLNPTASNPSGHVISDAQKKEIYDIACEFNLLILEDDPYYFLSFEEGLPRSFLSMDTEGRVVRFDSFSKIFSGGLRLGVMTAPRAIVRVVEMHMQASVLHASALSQMLVLQILNHLGWDGLREHADGIRDFYRHRRDEMLRLAEKHLTGLAEWNTPAGGMFLWLRILGVRDVWDMVMERGLRKDVMLVPGHAFMADPSQPCAFIRLSYSIAPLDQIDKAFGRTADLIREEQRLQGMK